MGCHFLLQGIFLTQGSNSGLWHCRQTLPHLSHQGIFHMYEIYIYIYIYMHMRVCVHSVGIHTLYIYIYIYAHVCVLNCFSHAPLCDPMDCGPPGSPVHGILLQEYTGVEGHVLLQAIFSGIEPASPSAPALQADSLPLSHRRSPIRTHTHPHPRTLTI